MNVGVVSTRFRGTDGVSLETAKVADVIEEAGHDVAWFAGELGERFHPGTTHPLAHFKAPAVLRITEAAYGQGAGLDPEDLLLLQPIRVVPRKGIETTLQLAYELADEHVKVVVSHEEGDEGPQYGQFLRDEAERLGVDLRFVPAAVDPVDEPGKPLLADAYAAADLVSYPSRYEG